MAANPVRRYVVRQIEAQGGWPVVYDRLAHGESIAEIATTLFRPDGPAINRRTLSMLLHQKPEREAATAAAVAMWRQHPEPLRRAIRKANKAERAAARAAAEDAATRDRLQAMMHGTTPAELPHYTMPDRPRPRPPQSVAVAPVAVRPEPAPEPPTQPGGVWWDAKAETARCLDCDRSDCQHAKHEYLRRVQAYTDRSFHPRVNPGLV